jgi:hypothetical protein
MLVRSAIRLAVMMVASALREESAINIHKPYKPRKLKTDMVHRMARQIYKTKKRDPAFKRKRALYRKKYLQRNGRNLKRRADYVREVRNDRGLNDG